VLHSGKRFQKKRNFFPECCTRGRVFKKNPVDGVKSSPSATVALGEAFPECTIFGTRGRALPREPLPRKLFSECCTRGRLPRVFLALPRVLEALGEAGGSCSVAGRPPQPVNTSCSGKMAVDHRIPRRLRAFHRSQETMMIEESKPLRRCVVKPRLA
jgi:hypothetical protein